MTHELSPRPDYVRPPVVEAALGIKYSSEIELNIIKKIMRATSNDLPDAVEHKHLNLHIKDEAVTGTHLFDGFTRSNNISGINLIVKRDEFGMSQYAPYPGWNKFFDAYRAYWSKFKKELPNGRINRLGVRYINRIDIPVPDDKQSISIADYANIGITTPKNMTPHSFTTQSGYQTEDGIKCNIVTSNIASPIFGHIGLIIDIDVFREDDLPQKENDVIEAFTKLRDVKNIIFTSLITERSAELFNRRSL